MAFTGAEHAVWWMVLACGPNWRGWRARAALRWSSTLLRWPGPGRSPPPGP